MCRVGVQRAARQFRRLVVLEKEERSNYLLPMSAVNK